MTFWLLQRRADDWRPVALFRTNDQAIARGQEWEGSGYEIRIQPVRLDEPAEAAG